MATKTKPSTGKKVTTKQLEESLKRIKGVGKDLDVVRRQIETFLKQSKVSVVKQVMRIREGGKKD